MLDELMNDCGDGKILIDIFDQYSKTGTPLKFIGLLLVNTLKTLPLMIIWGAVGIIFNLIGVFWVGGFGTGKFLDNLINAAAWPWN